MRNKQSSCKKGGWGGKRAGAGAPKGNKNAVGAGAPKENRNAVKHGCHSPRTAVEFAVEHMGWSRDKLNNWRNYDLFRNPGGMTSQEKLDIADAIRCLSYQTGEAGKIDFIRSQEVYCRALGVTIRLIDQSVKRSQAEHEIHQQQLVADIDRAVRAIWIKRRTSELPHHLQSE